MPANPEPVDCYLAPKYWDLAFSDETIPEADFIEAAALKYLGIQTGRVLDIGCGGGRQVCELAKRGWHVTGLDREPACIEWTRRQMLKLQRRYELICGDMTNFAIPGRVDLAHCLVNTFRHVTTDDDAIRHFNDVARALNPGGIYLLGFHLLPPDALELDTERWTVKHGTTRVTTTIRVLNFSRRKRLERVWFSLRASLPTRVLSFSAEHLLRIYRADQFQKLLKSVPAFELLDVFDFCYDLSKPLPLDDRLGDAVFVLRKR